MMVYNSILVRLYRLYGLYRPNINVNKLIICYSPTLDEIDPRDKPHVQVMTPINQLPILHIKATHNNTMITITDHTGRTVAWTSAVSDN